MGFIDYEVDGAVGIITINRPRALNALNEEVLNDLEQVLDAVDVNAIRCLILTGAGEKSFVAGADIGAMSTMTKAEGTAFGKKGNDIFLKIEKFPIPVIAAINGFALGGGCEISMSCDIRICSDNAVFGQPEANLGLIPCFGGTQRLSRLVGTGIAKELIYTCRQVKADEAKEIGLVNKVVPADELLNEAKAMMDMILLRSPVAIAYCKVAINRGVDTDLRNGLEIEKDCAAVVFSTEDKQEGVNAFLEKRKPVFKNR